MLHGLRRVKGRMYLCVSSRYEYCLYIVPSLCEGVLMDYCVEDTSRAGVGGVGSGTGSGTCGTGRCR